MFDHVYSAPHHQTERQQREYLEYLAGFSDGADSPSAHDAALAQAQSAGGAR
jgi:hypothetical protein